MNVKLLRKIQKHILAEPARYEQNAIITIGAPGAMCVAANRLYPQCGTIACIGGWAILLTAKRRLKTSRYSLNYLTLGKLLGVKKSQIAKLVSYTDYATEWPDHFADKYNQAETPKARARIAAQRIDHFIKTKGAE
jgi:hypothetical protein